MSDKPPKDFIAIMKAIESQRESGLEQVKEDFSTTWRRGGSLSRVQLNDLWHYVMDFEEIVSAHPFWPTWKKIDCVEVGFRILSDSFDRILLIYGELQASAEFSDIVNHDRIEREALNAIFQFSYAAYSLVDAYRGLRGELSRASQDAFDAFRTEMFSDQALAQFVQGLRNGISHQYIPRASSAFMVRFGVHRRVSSKIYFDSAALLREMKWNSAAREFVKRSDSVDIVPALKNYYSAAAALHRGYLSRSGLIFDGGFLEISRCYTARKTFEGIANLRLVLHQIEKQIVFPYDHLRRYFTEDEVARILSLPAFSQEQVDYMIELRDPLGLMPDHDRKKLYNLFAKPD
ncbi:hypothetical protein [Pararhodobacter aggregans]|uniref:hypothetical protein n=1 Tax=Pararhodobacter aggregans TaxID=404875 RepID=UPI0010575FA0|nr:hypothetical protein [Pararhodobacter aggregans]